MSAKPRELKARWSKKENDILFEWGAEGADKSDGSWLNTWLTYHKGFDSTFVKELEARGFDLKSLKISIRQKCHEKEK
jgi:hypothetical protein